jgi:predicted Zn-dependent protease with MMP-like domain
MPVMRVSRPAFERLVERALSRVPRPFRSALVNVSIEVKSRPGREAPRSKAGLLGLYLGALRAELTEPVTGGLGPSRIILYKENIERLCADEDALAREIEKTLRHEIAHCLGMEEADIRRAWPEGA